MRSGDALSAPERGEYCQLDYRHAYTLNSRLQISSSCPITAPQHPAVRRFLLALSTYERCDSPSPDTQPPLESSASHHHPRQQANHLMTCVDMMTCRMSPTSTKATTDPDPDPDMHTHTACNSQPSSSLHTHTQPATANPHPLRDSSARQPHQGVAQSPLLRLPLPSLPPPPLLPPPLRASREVLVYALAQLRQRWQPLLACRATSAGVILYDSYIALYHEVNNQTRQLGIPALQTP